MSDYRHIYATEAERYDALVSREDHQGNLVRRLAELVPHPVELGVELGAGTGRVTALIAPLCRQVKAFDASAHMLERAQDRLRGFDHVELAVADNAAIPLANGASDLVIAGWTIGHLLGWHPDDWEGRVDAVIGEMTRLGGRSIVIETLGTGVLEPGVPKLERFYQRLEQRHGFLRSVIRTDYAFADLDEAITLGGFFFGEAMAARIRENEWRIVPEHTGVWSRGAHG